MRLALLALCLVCVGARPAAGAPVDLLQTYAPVLYFHANENWAPESTDAFLADARVEKQGATGTWKPVPASLPTSTAGCTLTPCYRLNLPCPLHGGVALLPEDAGPLATQWQQPSSTAA